MNFYKTAAPLAILIAFLALSASPAEAQTLQERRAEIESRIDSIREQASTTSSIITESLEEGDMEKACDVTVERVDKRLEGFAQAHAAHTEVYDTHLARLQTISSKLSAQGLDVVELNTNIAVLEVKIAKFVADKETVISALEATKEFSCGDSDADFLQALTLVRDAQKILLEDARDISSFIKTAIKADLEVLREEYKESDNL